MKIGFINITPGEKSGRLVATFLEGALNTGIMSDIRFLQFSNQQIQGAIHYYRTGSALESHAE